jgi:hypothetical protein
MSAPVNFSSRTFPAVQLLKSDFSPRVIPVPQVSFAYAPCAARVVQLSGAVSAPSAPPVPTPVPPPLVEPPPGPPPLDSPPGFAPLRPLAALVPAGAPVTSISPTAPIVPSALAALVPSTVVRPVSGKYAVPPPVTPGLKSSARVASLSAVRPVPEANLSAS